MAAVCGQTSVWPGAPTYWFRYLTPYIAATLLTCEIGKRKAPNPVGKSFMKKIVPDPPRVTLDREIFERALSHYLQPDSPPSFTPHPDLSFEDALAQICDLLRCAAATAAVSSQGLNGDQRHIAGATEHLINSARALADRALNCLHAA